MSTKNYVEELEYSDAKGLDITSPINLLTSGFVRVAKNVNLGSTGGYTKRNGYINLFDTADQLNGFSIRQGLEYRKKFQPNTAPTVEILLYATNNNNLAKLGKIISDQFYEFEDNDNIAISLVNPSTSRLALSVTQRPSFAQINNSLYVINGANKPFVYEENSLYIREMGVETPATAPILDAGIIPNPSAGGSLEEGQYIYAYTYAFYLDNQLIAESNPSELSNTISTTSGFNTVNLVLSAFSGYSDPNLSHLTIVTRIWRTVVNGSILFLEAEIPGNSTTYASSTSDASLYSEQMPLDNTRLWEHTDYSTARYPIVARNRLLVFHPTVNSGRFSKIGPNGPLGESFPASNEFSIEGRYGAADGLVGSGQIKGIPIVLKERSIGRLEEVGLPDLGNSADNVTYVYREISETIGAVSHFAQCQVFDELVFLGHDNVYATDGINVRPIATQIQPIIKQADFTGDKSLKLSAINDTKNKRIYIQICQNTNSSEPDITLVGDYQQYPTFRWTTYEEGPETDMPGIKAGCFFQTEATVDGGLEIFFGSATDEGQYYKMNVGGADYKIEKDATTITPSKIYMRLVSRPYMFGHPMITKLYKTAKIFAEGQAETYDFLFGAIFDLAQNETGTISYTVPGTGTTWDSYNWYLNSLPLNTILYWSGNSLNEFKFTTHRKAKMMQLVFTQNDKNAPVTLLGWGVSGSIFSGI